jgi:purine-binding chemotaxis protein CheW
LSGSTAVVEMLVIGVGAQLCALPLRDVVEIMRPLPIGEVAGAPSFVRGVAVIRGELVPVVETAMLLGAMESAAPSRFVTIRAGDRVVALAVTTVLGIRKLPAASLREAPPLLRDIGAELVETLGRLDQELLLVLRTGRMLPPEFQIPIEAGASRP